MSAVSFRCPFCHAGVVPSSEPARACGACFAPHHADCWDELARCGACGETSRLPRGSRLWPWLAGFATAAGLALVVAAAAASPASPSSETPPPVAPSPIRPGERRTARAWLEDARARSARGDHEGALAAVDRALSAAPRAEYAHRCRALVLRAKGQLAGALASATRAIELDARSHAAWTLRGSLRLDAGDRAGAVGDFDEALRIAPASEWARAEVIRARSRR